MPLARRRRFYIPYNDLEAKKAREEKALIECAKLALNDSLDNVKILKSGVKNTYRSRENKLSSSSLNLAY